jgi:hypothetical protein
MRMTHTAASTSNPGRSDCYAPPHVVGLAPTTDSRHGKTSVAALQTQTKR